MRHRRRCQRPSKPLTRRKACNECVQAKAKCCYSQPTCWRCAKRGIACRYVSVENNDLKESNVGRASRRTSLDTQRSQAGDAAHKSLSSTSPDASLAEPFEVPSSWSSQISSWHLDALDTPLQASAPLAVTGFAAVDGMLGTATPHGSTPTSTFQPPTSRQMYSSLPGHDSLIPSSSPMSGFASRASGLSLGGLDALSEPLNASDVLPYNPYNPYTLIHLLGQYPTLLPTDDFCSPFLHRAMYNERVPDMTTLPRTSMAICCSSGINSADSSRYIKRAMDAERQSLIEVYVSIPWACALHTLAEIHFTNPAQADV